MGGKVYILEMLGHIPKQCDSLSRIWLAFLEYSFGFSTAYLPCFQQFHYPACHLALLRGFYLNSLWSSHIKTMQDSSTQLLIHLCNQNSCPGSKLSPHISSKRTLSNSHPFRRMLYIWFSQPDALTVAPLCLWAHISRLVYQHLLSSQDLFMWSITSYPHL